MKKSKLLVIDTNTLISAFILPGSISRKALNKARNDGYIVLSETTANEFTDVFIRPKFDKYLPLAIRLEIIDDFKSLILTENPDINIQDCKDPKDNKFLEIAVFVGADCIITGDQDLLVLNPFRGISIITASQYLTAF